MEIKNVGIRGFEDWKIQRWLPYALENKTIIDHVKLQNY